MGPQHDSLDCDVTLFSLTKQYFFNLLLFKFFVWSLH